MRTSRAFFSEVERRFDAVPFTLSASEDEKKAQMGAAECAKHELLQSLSALSLKRRENLLPSLNLQCYSSPRAPCG